MKDIEQLLEQLVAYAYVERPTCSVESRYAQRALREEFKKLKDSGTDKQKEMITLFIGGVIIALYVDDANYRYKERLYPEKTVDVAGVAYFKTENFVFDSTDINFMHAVGTEALKNIPQSFNSEMFKKEFNLINSNKPIPFFPLLAKHSKKIDELVNFLQGKDNNQSNTVSSTVLSENKVINSITKDDNQSNTVSVNVLNESNGIDSITKFIEKKIKAFRLGSHSFFAVNMNKKANLIESALNNARKNLIGSDITINQFLDYKANNTIMSLREALNYNRLLFKKPKTNTLLEMERTYPVCEK